MSFYYRVIARLAKDGKNIVVERQWQIREDQEGDRNWTTVDRFNTPSLSKIPPSKNWMEPIPPAQGICDDEECAEYYPHVHFMTDPLCINYKFDEIAVGGSTASGCEYCDHGELVHVNYGKRQHLADGLDERGEYLARWVDCPNQQKLLTAGPWPKLDFDNLGDLEIKIIAAVTDHISLYGASFISTAITQATAGCNCQICLMVRDIIKNVIYGDQMVEAV